MVGRLYTDEAGAKKNRDVGVELVRSGLAQKQARYDYKYGELSAAEAEAKTARRGLSSPDKQRQR
jgi:endonuclease YncB( thermonuclease family)